MKKSDKPKKSRLTLIPIDLAKHMVSAYDERRRLPAARERSASLGKEMDEPRSVWVSKEAVLELLEINKADGLRFYFAIADDFPDHKLKKQEYKGAHTLVMVATRSADPEDPTMENSVDCLNIPGKTDARDATGKVGPILMPVSSGRAGMPADDMTLCPPPRQPSGMLL